MRMCQMMSWLFWKIFNGNVISELYIPSVVIDFYSNTGCNTRIFFVIPAVIQASSCIAQRITDNCPVGAYIERVLGGFYSP